MESPMESQITNLVLEYALTAPADRPLRAEYSLRDEIGLDSFALVSLMLRLGEEFSVDLAEESSRLGINMQEILTFGDLVGLARALSAARPAAAAEARST
jgi:acyl carrier protein